MDSIIEQARNGDTEALEALWEQTKAFAFTVSRRFRSTPSVGADDLQQCAWLGFYVAVQKHVEKHNFLTTMDFCIRNECQKALHIRTSKRDPLTVSYDAPAPDGEQAIIDLFVDESIPESDEPIIAADLARDIRAAVAELPAREKKLIELRWLGDEPLTLSATGKHLGISGERAAQIERRAFDRLRADPILGTYVANPCPIGYSTGLSRFQSTHLSGTELDALRFVKAEEKRQERKRTHAAYADLLASLAAEGFL